MAVDTRDKRASLLGGRVLPIADGSISAADRRHLLGLYRFGADGPGPVPTAVEIDELVADRIRGDVAGLGGRVWCDEAPARAALPYAVVQLQGSTPSYESAVAGGPAIEGDDEAELLVTLHAATRAEAKALLRLAEASAVSGSYPGAVMYLRRSNRLVELAPQKINGADVWLGLLGLRAIVELE